MGDRVLCQVGREVLAPALGGFTQWVLGLSLIHIYLGGNLGEVPEIPGEEHLLAFGFHQEGIT